LKQSPDPQGVFCINVAPLAGAWIETALGYPYCDGGSVAPLAGAWIETRLKKAAEQKQTNVAPLAGAWIETRQTTQGN